MKWNNLPVVFAIVALVVSVIACGGSFSTANIEDAWLTTDEEGANRTTVFSQSDTFNLFVDLRNAPDDTNLKASWIAVNAEGVDANSVVYESDYTSSDDTIRFFLTNDQLWPVGSYKVDVYLNGSLERSLDFQVQ
jgi:hypothetical protein